MVVKHVIAEFVYIYNNYAANLNKTSKQIIPKVKLSYNLTLAFGGLT